MATLHTTLTSILGAGDHIVAQRALYGGTFSLVTRSFARYGISSTLVEPEARAVEQRPKVFYTGYDVYDPQHVGFVTSGPEAERVGFKYEVCTSGNSQVGHTYGTQLKDGEKWELIEYMKTL